MCAEVGGWDRSADAVQTSFQLLPLHLLIWFWLFLPLQLALGRCAPENQLLPPQPRLCCDLWPWLVPGRSPERLSKVPGCQSVTRAEEQWVSVLPSLSAAGSWLCNWQSGCKVAVSPAQQLAPCDGRAYPAFTAALWFNSNRRKSPRFSCGHWLERGDFECTDLSLPHTRLDKRGEFQH